MYLQELKFEHPTSGRCVSIQSVLQQRVQRMRENSEQWAQQILAHKHINESDFVDMRIREVRVAIPQFDFEDIKKTDKYEQKHGSQLRGLIFPGDENGMFRVWIVTFGIRYTGNIEFLQYLPRSGTGSVHHKFTYDGERLYFHAQVLDAPQKDVKSIETARDSAIKFLRERVEAITPELEEFNSGVAAAVRAQYEAMKKKYQTDKDTLAQL